MIYHSWEAALVIDLTVHSFRSHQTLRSKQPRTCSCSLISPVVLLAAAAPKLLHHPRQASQYQLSQANPGTFGPFALLSRQK